MKKHKICIIARGITRGGVCRYLKNTLIELDKKKSYQIILITNSIIFKEYKYKNIITIFSKTKNKIVFDYFTSFNLIKKINPDIIIYPKNIIPLFHFFLKTKKINIIHDLGYFENKISAYPFLNTLFIKIFMRVSCLISNRIIAVSESTKKDIINRLKIKKQKITVVYEGVESNFKTLNKDKAKILVRKYNIQMPFLFYSGSISPRKNLLNILKAFNLIKNKIPHNLYITGLKTWSSGSIFDYIKKNLNTRVKILGYVSENELIALYNLADLYLYPSLYEGFGLPILEAQACGCPVLTSNVTSCPEIAGKGAIFVCPHNITQIANKTEKILNDKKLKNSIIAKGYKNIKLFSWKKCAKEVLNVCEGVCDEK